MRRVDATWLNRHIEKDVVECDSIQTDAVEILATMIRVMRRHRKDADRRERLVALFAEFSSDLCDALDLDHAQAGADARALAMALEAVGVHSH